MEEQEYQKLLEKYKAKIKEEFGENANKPNKVSSKEYSYFKKELHLMIYPVMIIFFLQMIQIRMIQ